MAIWLRERSRVNRTLTNFILSNFIESPETNHWARIHGGNDRIRHGVTLAVNCHFSERDKLFLTECPVTRGALMFGSTGVADEFLNKPIIIFDQLVEALKKILLFPPYFFNTYNVCFFTKYF